MRRIKTLPGVAFGLSLNVGVYSSVAAASGGESEEIGFIWMLAVVYLIIAAFRKLQIFGTPKAICALIAGMTLSAIGYYGDFSFVEAIRVSTALYIFGTIGMIKVIFRAGEHESLADMRKVGLLASLVAVIGVLLPGVGVYAIVKLLRPDAASIEVLLLACTMVATSIALATAQLTDMGIINHPAAKIIIAAAVVDDILGLIILSAVVAFEESGTVDYSNIALMALWSVIFIAGALAIGELLAGRMSQYFSRLGTDRQTMYQYVIIVMLLGAWAAHGFGQELIIGAFVAGVAMKKVHFEHYESPALVVELQEILGRRRVEVSAIHSRLSESIQGNGHSQEDKELLVQLGRIAELEQVEINDKLREHKKNDVANMLEQGSWLFEEVFFFKIGLGISFAVFSAGLLLPVIIIAIAGLLLKMAAGAIVPGTIAVKMLVGAGMGPRGEVGLIFAEVGRDIGALTGEGFAIGVMSVVATTLIAPFIITFFGHRVRREEALASNSASALA